MDDALVLELDAVQRTHWWFVVRRRIVTTEVARSLPPDARVLLEVGCGTGGMLTTLEGMREDMRVIAVEPSEVARDVAVRAGHSAVPGTFDRIPLGDESVDALVALDVLEHCEDDAASIAEAARVIRPGGCLVMTVPALRSLWSPHDEANRHFRRYQRTELVGLVAAGGFEVERATYFNTLLLPLVYAARLGAKAAHRQGLVGTRPPWGPANAALRTVFSAEEPWLRRHRLPIGASLLVSARRSSRDG